MKKIHTIWFFGTPELSAKVLQKLIEHPEFSVQFAITNPDKKIWREQKITETPVKTLAKLHNIPVFSPEKIRGNTDFLEEIAQFPCDYFVVVAYGKILPKEILEMPKNMCINIHGSLLPKYRGASPIQSALLFGETETGVTIMQMNEKMDEGDMICMQKIKIDPIETTETLFEKFWHTSPEALIQGILWLESGKFTLTPQNHAEATYCEKITKDHGEISWQDDAKNIFHKWQAYTPWPGIFTFFHKKRLKIEKCHFVEENHNFPLGQVLKDAENQVFISAKSGKIFPEIVKLEGKKSQNISDFINGNPHFINTIL